MEINVSRNTAFIFLASLLFVSLFLAFHQTALAHTLQGGCANDSACGVENGHEHECVQGRCIDSVAAGECTRTGGVCSVDSDCCGRATCVDGSCARGDNVGPIDDGDGDDVGPIGGNGVSIQNPLKAGSIEELLDSVAFFLYTVAIPLTTIIILFGAFQLLTSGGNEDKVKAGKRTLLWAVVGFTIVFIAGGVASIISNLLGGAS